MNLTLQSSPDLWQFSNSSHSLRCCFDLKADCTKQFSPFCKLKGGGGGQIGGDALVAPTYINHLSVYYPDLRSL